MALPSSLYHPVDKPTMEEPAKHGIVVLRDDSSILLPLAGSERMEGPTEKRRRKCY